MGAPLQLVTPSKPAGASSAPSLERLVAREKRQARRRRLWWGAGALVVVGLAVGLGLALRPKPVPLSARFRTQAVTVGSVVHEVSATGHLEAVSEVPVGAEVSGRIESVEVDFNSPVKAGQVLARFDKRVLSAQVAQTRALLAAAKAQLAQAKVDAQQSERLFARAKVLYAQKTQSEQEYEASQTAAQLSRARVDAVAAQVAAQEAALDVAQGNLAHAEIRAPGDGVIIARNVDPGQTVASMLQAPVLFSVAADLVRMRVVAAVDEADIAEVKPGQPATFTVTAWPERVFNGKVIEVRNAPQIMQDVVTYGVVGEVDNSDLALKPGMTATVRIRTAAVESSDRVPAIALHFTPPGEHRAHGEPAVWLLENDALRKVTVVPGISDGDVTAVAAGAVQAGAVVVVDVTPEGRRAYGLDVKR